MDMDDECTHMRKCKLCERTLFKRKEQKPVSYIYLEFITAKDDKSVYIEQTLFCDKICLGDWVNKSLPAKN